MKLAYLDSSVILSIIFKDTYAEEAKNIFQNYKWVSSRLLLFECVNVLVRESQKQKSADKILAESLKYFNQLTDYVNIIPIDNEVLNKVLSDKRIAKGRTLDAIHLASALLVQENYEERLKLATFDIKLADLGHELGLDNVKE
jgi:predicted nucleic acid-binding protein